VLVKVVAFQHFAAKPKNYPPTGLTNKAAETEFFRLAEEPCAITDNDGDHTQYQFQVAIKTKTLVVDRDMKSRSQGYSILDRAMKNFGQADVDRQYTKLHTSMEDVSMASNQMTKQQTHEMMASGSKQGGGANSSAFDGQLARLGGVQALKGLVEEDKPPVSDNEDEESEEEESLPPGKKRKSDAEVLEKPVKKIPKLWLDKGLQIGVAQREQTAWKNEMKSTLRELHTEMVTLIAEIIAAGLEAMLLPELTQATPRLNAVGLVLSLYQPLRLTTDQPDPPSPGKSSELALSPSAADKSLTVAVAALDPSDLGLAELTNVDCPQSSKKEDGENKSDAVREDEPSAEEAAKLEAAKLVCAQLEQAKQEALKSAPEARLEAAKSEEAAAPADAAAEAAAAVEAAAVASGSTLAAQDEQKQGAVATAHPDDARPDAAAHVAGEALVSKEPGGRQFEFRFDLTMLAVFI
jgi:hypothetical protein